MGTSIIAKSKQLPEEPAPGKKRRPRQVVANRKGFEADSSVSKSKGRFKPYSKDAVMQATFKQLLYLAVKYCGTWEFSQNPGSKNAITGLPPRCCKRSPRPGLKVTGRVEGGGRYVKNANDEPSSHFRLKIHLRPWWVWRLHCAVPVGFLASAVEPPELSAEST